MNQGGALDFKTLLLITLVMGSGACKKIEVNSDDTVSATTTTTTSSTCADVDKYSSLLACKLITGANCNSSVETFSGGSQATCYTPKEGWESCLTNPPNWEYTAYNLIGGMTGGFQISRSLLGCSSEICYCQGAIELTPGQAFTVAAYTNSGCTTGSSCTCSIADCPWGESDIIVPATPVTAGLDWTLTLASGTTVASTDSAPTLTMTGSIPSSVADPLELILYTDSSCATVTGPASTAITVTGTSGGAIATTASTTAGLKSFFYKIHNTNTNVYTGCVDTGKSYYYIMTPEILSAGGLFPSGQKMPNQTVTVDFYDNSISGDYGVTYTNCYYDRTVDGSTAGGTACTSLPGYSSAAFATSGAFTWLPGSTEFGPYEICVTGTNIQASDSGCGVYDIQPSIHTTGLTHYYDAQFARSGGGPGVDGAADDDTLSLLTTASALDGSLANFGHTAGSGWKGAVTLTSTTNEHALDLDGTDDYVDLGTPNDSYSSETIDVWVMPKNVAQTGNRIIYTHGNASVGSAARGLTLLQKFGAPTKFVLSIGENTSSGVYCTSNVSALSYHWYHITASYDSSSGLKMYVNGSLASGCSAAAGGATLAGSTKNFYIGKSSAGAVTSEWNGRFANLKIYNTSTSVATISATNYAAEKQRFVFLNNAATMQLPNDFSNLSLWLNAESFQSSSGAAVSTWLDLSPDAEALTTPATDPLFYSGVTTNGYPTVRFSTGMRFQYTEASLPAGYTVFVVARVTTTNSTVVNPFLATSGTTQNAAYNMAVRGSAMADAGYVNTGFGDGTDYFYSTTNTNQYTFGSSEFAIFEKVKVSGGTEDIYKDGILSGFTFVDSGTCPTNSAGTGTTTYIGTNPSGNYLNGDIAEMVVFKTSLSAGDRLYIERYLGQKYGITVP